MGVVMRGFFLAVAVSSVGCASLGWRYWKQEHTYTYEREVAVDVQSEPAGATIVDETGKVLGTAPMTMRVKHTVRRTLAQRSHRSALLGCVANLAIGGYLLYSWASNVSTRSVDPRTGFPTFETDIISSTGQQLRLLGWTGALMDCGIVAIVPPAERKLRASTERDSMQVQELPYKRDVVSEQVIAKPTVIEARWRDWSPVKTTVEVPGTGSVTLRRGHRNTFDDAIVRRVRLGVQLGPEGTYRAGHAFVKMARETKNPEHATMALTLLERYASGPIDEARRPALERLLVELRAMVKR